MRRNAELCKTFVNWHSSLFQHIAVSADSQKPNMQRSWGKCSHEGIWWLYFLKRFSWKDLIKMEFQNLQNNIGFSEKIKQMNKAELTRLYSSLFPTSSSSSLCSWERDLTEATDNIKVWNQARTHKRTHTHTTYTHSVLTRVNMLACSLWVPVMPS